MIAYDVATPGRKTWEHEDREGNDICVTTAPGYDLQLWCICQSVELDDQDVEPLIEALRQARDDDQGMTFESCLADDQWVSVTRGTGESAGWVRVENGGEFVTIPLPDVSSVIAILIDAHEYAVAGSCPFCGYSLADDHPANGCRDDDR